jgi:MOSC domain-containing protein YiiM
VNGRLTRIFLRPSARTPVKQVERATAFPGMGLEGDHAGGGNRQVTLISEESWQAACEELGKPGLDPGLRRANLVVEGVDLAAAIGKALQIGACRIRVIAETRPCRLMDDAEPGLQLALDPDRRGGVYGRVMEGGRVEAGARVEILEIPEALQSDPPLGAQQ